MKLYNSLTKTIEEFNVQENEITIYTCGPTVYERAHIGNLASFIYADTLKRVLKLAFPNKSIKHVMNTTDIDDKTIAASREKYPELDPDEALHKLTREYEELFKNDLTEIGVDIEEITFVRATENIEAMQNLIKQLLRDGFAYIGDDGIYFSIEKYKQAGKKYGQLVEITAQSTGKARVKNDEYDKDNVHDFALWKAQKENEPAWSFDVNGENIKGRPGWHIECSAMSIKELGQPFDIHTGGVDLKFPHHENEIAQSTANDGDLLAHLFFHSEHMLVDGKKMSKSLNNFYTLEDIGSWGINPLAFRLFVLEGHYRRQRSFSRQNLMASANRLSSWRQAASSWKLVPNPEEWAQSHQIESGKDEIIYAMKEDLNTPAALERIDSEFTQIWASNIRSEALEKWQQLVIIIENLFGLDIKNQIELNEEQEELVNQREEARKNQDWQKADELRDRLLGQGIEINDTPNGPVWSRK
jgi:cysteinyl-tRNA synthetase